MAGKYPRKRVAMNVASDWSFDAHANVCRYMRGTARNKRSIQSAKRVVAALNAYMKHSASVAPSLPVGAGPAPSPLVLWRGVRGAVPAVGSTVPSNGGCYTAFSYMRDVAVEFASSDDGFLYRLQADRIARGTPWTWFTAQLENVQGLPPRWRDTVQTDVDEGEVLLPPGYFKVLRVSGRSGVPVVDVAFVPRPQYVRRGALPRLNQQRRVVAKTVGGHRVVLNGSTAARNNVGARRARLVRKAANAATASRTKKPRRR